jgi:hypothetical protein
MVLAKDCAIKWESNRNVERTAVSFVAFCCKIAKVNSQCSLDTAKKDTYKSVSICPSIFTHHDGNI